MKLAFVLADACRDRVEHFLVGENLRAHEVERFSIRARIVDRIRNRLRNVADLNRLEPALAIANHRNNWKRADDTSQNTDEAIAWAVDDRWAEDGPIEARRFDGLL